MPKPFLNHSGDSRNLFLPSEMSSRDRAETIFQDAETPRKSLSHSLDVQLENLENLGAPSEMDLLNGIAMEQVEDFFTIQMKNVLGLTLHNGQLQIVNPIVSVQITDELNSSSEFKLVVTTSQAHRLYRFDSVSFEGISASTPNHVGQLINHDNGESTYRVSAVICPTEFEVLMTLTETEAEQRYSSGAGGVVVTPPNMYKACPEVIIPQTTIEERLVWIRDQKNLELLRSSVNRSSADVTLDRAVELPDANGNTRTLQPGITAHGRLSQVGIVRRNYWKLANERADLWRTDHSHGRSQARAEDAPSDVAELEDRVWNLDSVKVGDILVFRRGCVRTAMSRMSGCVQGVLCGVIPAWPRARLCVACKRSFRCPITALAAHTTLTATLPSLQLCHHCTRYIRSLQLCHHCTRYSHCTRYPLLAARWVTEVLLVLGGAFVCFLDNFARAREGRDS